MERITDYYSRKKGIQVGRYTGIQVVNRLFSTCFPIYLFTFLLVYIYDELTGEKLTIEDVVAVARHGLQVAPLSNTVIAHMNQS